MPIDFFHKTVRDMQEKFNQAYDGLVVFSTKQRTVLILSIANLGIRARKLSASQEKDKSDIREFMRRKKIIEDNLNALINNRRCQDVERTDQRGTLQTSKAV